MFVEKIEILEFRKADLTIRPKDGATLADLMDSLRGFSSSVGRTLDKPNDGDVEYLIHFAEMSTREPIGRLGDTNKDFIYCQRAYPLPNGMGEVGRFIDYMRKGGKFVVTDVEWDPENNSNK